MFDRPDPVDRIRQCEDVGEVFDICAAGLGRHRAQHTAHVLAYVLIVGDECLDGRSVIPQIPAAQRPANVAS